MSYSKIPIELNLALTLTLECDGKTAQVSSGNIERLDLQLHSYGHTCQVQFSGFDDEKVDALFALTKEIKVNLVLKPVESGGQIKEGEPLLELKGIAFDKCYKRTPSPPGKAGKPYRLYELTFSDKAKVTWSEHFPLGLYVDTSMKEIIEKQINPELGSIKYDCPPLEAPSPVTAFSLEYREGLPDRAQTSFYSFIHWYLQQVDGIWTYDYKGDSYAISQKKTADGKPVEVLEGWVEPPVCIFPQPPRYNKKIFKHTFDSAESEDQENEDAFKAVLRQSIDPENYRCFPEQAFEKVLTPLNPTLTELELEFSALPYEKIDLGKLIPGSLLQFKPSETEGNWSVDPCYEGKTFRVRNVTLLAEKVTLSDEVQPEVQSYQLRLKLKLEDKEELFIERPEFNSPRYPFAIQGTIFSDVGDKEQSTFKIQESDKAPQGQYLVQVPLTGDDKKLVVPFTPDFMSGQYYFPFTKGQRVELALYFHTAKILRVSDWQPLTRLPIGTQGNQIVMASNGQDKFVIMKHEFENGQNSMFTLQQSSSETQTQTIQIQEGDFEITVANKDKKILNISMKMDGGVVATLEDKESGATQQLKFDGETIVITCKGSAGTSIIEQKPDAISVQCDTFSVKAKTILMDAKDAISQSGANKVNFKSKVVNLEAPSVKHG